MNEASEIATTVAAQFADPTEQVRKGAAPPLCVKRWRCPLPDLFLFLNLQ